MKMTSNQKRLAIAVGSLLAVVGLAMAALVLVGVGEGIQQKQDGQAVAQSAIDNMTKDAPQTDPAGQKRFTASVCAAVRNMPTEEAWIVQGEAWNSTIATLLDNNNQATPVYTLEPELSDALSDMAHGMHFNGQTEYYAALAVARRICG